MEIIDNKVVFSDGELYDLCDHLSIIISEGLKQFKEMDRISVPSPYMNHYDDWENTLDFMIEYLDFRNAPSYRQGYELVQEWEDNRKIALSLFVRYFDYLWD